MNKAEIRQTHTTECCTFCGGRKITTYVSSVGMHRKQRITGKCPACKGEGVKYQLPSGFWDINYVIRWHKSRQQSSK